MTKHFCGKILGLFILIGAAFAVSACSSWLPDSWNDPVYFGKGDNLGKNVGGSGTGGEVKNPKSNFTLY